MAGTMDVKTDAGEDLAFASRPVPSDRRIARLPLTMAWWSVCSAMFYLFVAASLAQAKGFPGKSHLLIFDLRNPFVGLLPPRECATHTWDVVALLGSCEDRLDESYKAVIREFRERVLRYVANGEEPWPAWTAEEGLALLVDKEGCEVVGREFYM